MPIASSLGFHPRLSPEKELFASYPDQGATGTISANEFYEKLEWSLSSENIDYSQFKSCKDG